MIAPELCGSAILAYGHVRLLNVPHAKALADEVITEDCYDLLALSGIWNVLDVGACYGEFALFAASRGHSVLAIEPTHESVLVLTANIGLHQMLAGSVDVKRAFVTSEKTALLATHSYRRHHPAGSGPECGDGVSEPVVTLQMKEAVRLTAAMDPDRKLLVKMDCEGAESEIFKDVDSWISGVDRVAMEFHNHDAHIYSDILKARGFSVVATGGGPKPRPPADRTIGGGLIIAQRT